MVDKAGRQSVQPGRTQCLVRRCAIDLGTDYGFALAKELAGDVTATGLTF